MLVIQISPRQLLYFGQLVTQTHLKSLVKIGKVLAEIFHYIELGQMLLGQMLVGQMSPRQFFFQFFEPREAYLPSLGLLLCLELVKK